MSLSKRAFAEFIGTFWLVFGGCGSAVLAAAFPTLGIGFVGVALAFGLTVLTMAYAIGHISGCHLNPAVSAGLVVGKRFPVSELPMYVIAQVLGAVAGSGILYLIASGKEGFSLAGGFAANGYAEHSPGGYSMVACLVAGRVGGLHPGLHIPAPGMHPASVLISAMNAVGVPTTTLGDVSGEIPGLRG